MNLPKLHSEHGHNAESSGENYQGGKRSKV